MAGTLTFTEVVLFRAAVERSSTSSGVAWEATLGLALAATVAVTVVWLLTLKLGRP